MFHESQALSTPVRQKLRNQPKQRKDHARGVLVREVCISILDKMANTPHPALSLATQQPIHLHSKCKLLIILYA